MKFFKNIWKYSRVRFYILNSLWNYRFWLFAKKMFKYITYQVEDGKYELDDTLKVKRNIKKITKRRFAGYFFKNNIYWDNPGFKIEDRKTWESWKKRGLIK